MKKMTNHALIIDDSFNVMKPLEKFMIQTGWIIDYKKNDDQLFDALPSIDAEIIIINITIQNALELIDSVQNILPDRYVIAATNNGSFAERQTELMDRVFDFVTIRNHPDSFIPVIKRASEFCRLRLQLKSGQYKTNQSEQKTIADKIETERFLAVHQVIDKMSSFLAHVIDDIHGGVKYFNELPFFVSIHGQDSKILAANPTYYKYIGNMVYHDSWVIYTGKRASKHACPVGMTLKTGNVKSTRALVKYKSGARVPVLVHTYPIYNNDGDVEFVLEVFAGAKEIDHLAHEISSTQQRYQVLFDSVPNHIAVLDRRFNLTAINQKFKMDFGDYTNHNFFEVLRPAVFPAYRDPITQTVRNGMPHQGEMIMTDLNGIQHNMMAWTSPIKTAAGKLIQVLAIFVDITELRKLQKNLATIGLMVGTVSHDLKGSLTGLDAGLYLIESGFYRDKPGRIEEGLDVVKLMVERIRKLVYDILYSAKERDLELEETDALDFSGDIAANIDVRIRSAGIEFQCELEPELGRFKIDIHLLRTAFVNLLENAIEACIDDDSKKSHVIQFKASRTKHHLQFEISDNGSGVSKLKTNQMFDLFYSSKGRKGTGLGLFITKRVVQKHGGNISVESEPGQWTKFTISIPGIKDS